MTVYENMAFGLKLRKVPKETIKRRVEAAAKILGIENLLNRKPAQMSGGQKQRVALGRAIVREPKVFLLDEPLSNLDAKLRAAMRTEITKIHQTVGTTFIYVTHDQVEAMTMATRIVVMKDGFTQQVDSPQNLYDKPVNIFVAGFIGTPQMNFLHVTLEKRGDDAYIVFGENAIKLPSEKASDPALEAYFGKEVIAGIRPELIHDEELYLNSMKDNVIEAKVDVTELMGAEIYLYLAIEGVEAFNLDSNKGENIKNDIIAKVSSRSGARAGDMIKIAIDSSRIHLFDKETQKYIIH
jgi:multiple sugar transport system ATP-binding protein